MISVYPPFFPLVVHACARYYSPNRSCSSPFYFSRTGTGADTDTVSVDFVLIYFWDRFVKHHPTSHSVWSFIFDRVPRICWPSLSLTCITSSFRPNILSHRALGICSPNKKPWDWTCFHVKRVWWYTVLSGASCPNQKKRKTHLLTSTSSKNLWEQTMDEKKNEKERSRMLGKTRGNNAVDINSERWEIKTRHECKEWGKNQATLKCPNAKYRNGDNCQGKQIDAYK